MDNEQEDDGLEYGFDCVAKDEGQEYYLWTYKEKYFWRRDFKKYKPYYNYDNGSDNINHVMKLVHCCLGVVECQGKSSSLSESIDLIKVNNGVIYIPQQKLKSFFFSNKVNAENYSLRF